MFRPLVLASGRYDLFWAYLAWGRNLPYRAGAFEVIGLTGFDFRQTYNRGAFSVPPTWRLDA
jgi:hypothetical protein